MKTFLKQYLQDNSVSIEELSLRMGVSRQYASQLVKEGVTPNLSTVDKLCTALNCRIQDLFEAEPVDLSEKQKAKVELLERRLANARAAMKKGI